MQHPQRVVVFLGISLDGFIAGEGGDLSWLSECAAESTAETGYDELMARTDALLMGRNTYDSVLGFDEWPFGTKRVYVMTNRPITSRPGVCAMQGDIDKVIRSVHASGANGIYLDGGNVVRQALQKGLVDELVLSWIPVVLGKGVKLFEDGLSFSRWRLMRSRALRSGMVQAFYQRLHAPALS